MAMYRDQVTRWRRELRMGALRGLAVDTVDAFEGEEADVVILSLVRSNEAERIGFLKKAQRLNVAISRAKQLLVVVGDIETMTGREGQDLYRPLLEHVEREGRVAGIGALHAMDQAVGGRRRNDRRRPRPGAPLGVRRRGRGYGRRPVPSGTPVPTNGTESQDAQPAEAGAPPPRKFRRRRGRRRGVFAANNGAPSSASGDGGAPPATEGNAGSTSPQPERAAAAQASERPS